MKNTHPAEIHLSALLARNGPVVIFQGFYKQALFVSRENVPRFIRNPERTPLLVIPPLASLALNSYLAAEDVDSIELKRDIALSDEFILTIRRSGKKSIRYYSDHENLVGGNALHAAGIGIVITPRMSALVDISDSEPKLSIIVESASGEEPDYPNRFAYDCRLLSDAVARTVTHLYPMLRYEDRNT